MQEIIILLLAICSYGVSLPYSNTQVLQGNPDLRGLYSAVPLSAVEETLAEKALYNTGGDIKIKHMSKSAILNEDTRWPKGIIPYSVEPKFVNEVTPFLDYAISEIHQKTQGCITFVPRTAQENYVHIIKEVGCWSYVGSSHAGEQKLSLGVGCVYVGSILHELMHAIGFYHEHQTSNRDDHLSIHWENIEQSGFDSFEKKSPENEMKYNEFDLTSIMMYGETAFSKNGKKTIEDKEKTVKILNPFYKLELTKSDAYRIRKLYGCE